MIITALAVLTAFTGSQTNAETPARLRGGIVTSADYPAAAIRAGEEGSTRMTLSISEAGRVTGCQVVTSSGSRALDVASCALATERYQFEPARDTAGRAVASTTTQSINWNLPGERGRSGLGPDPRRRALAFAPIRIILTATFRGGSMHECVRQGSSAGREQRLPRDACARTMQRTLRWATDRGDVQSVTQIVAFTPTGMEPLAIDPEWGSMVVRAEADVVVGSDGQVASCTDRNEAAPDAAPLGRADACSLSGRSGQAAFVPAEDASPRTGHVIIATFAVRGAPPRP